MRETCRASVSALAADVPRSLPRRARPGPGDWGFDAVIGNPPWDMVRGDSGDEPDQAGGESTPVVCDFVRESGDLRVSSSRARQSLSTVRRARPSTRSTRRPHRSGPAVGLVSDAGAPLCGGTCSIARMSMDHRPRQPRWQSSPFTAARDSCCSRAHRTRDRRRSAAGSGSLELGSRARTATRAVRSPTGAFVATALRRRRPRNPRARHRALAISPSSRARSARVAPTRPQRTDGTLRSAAS